MRHRLPFGNPFCYRVLSNSTLCRVAVSPPPRGGERTERDCMAKETRQKKGDPAPRKKVKSPSKPAARPLSLAKQTAKASVAKARPASRGPAKPQARPDPKQSRLAVKPADKPQPPQAPAPVPRKPGYYEALAMYENGVRALQRHDYQGAAAQFRAIMERYPEERELQERSHLYLRVCERETARRPATPQTPQEQVYAATVALNAGDTSGALDHLRRALTGAPDSDHAHYIMSVALTARGDSLQAVDHLRQAITLNPENRALARQDPDLEPLRFTDEFRDLVDAPDAARSRSRKRR
jgi:tetratricopeptide (TPR) repeat protein